MANEIEILGATFLNAAARDGSRPTAETVLRSIKKAVDMNDWRVIVSISRKIYANMGIPKGAINLKAMLSVGEAWDPVYLGPDEDWGAQARTWLLENFYPVGNVRGPLFDFKTDLFLDSVSVDREGDYFYLLTASDSGFPMVQAIPNYLIRTPPPFRNGAGGDIKTKIPRYLQNPNASAADLEKGPVEVTLKAASIYNGVAYNSVGRGFAFCMYEEANESFRNESANYKWVHETYMAHIFDPEWYDQGRGFPTFTHAVREFISSLTSQQFEEITHMIMSSISLAEQNEEGASSATDPTATIGTNTLKENFDATAAGEIPDIVIEKIVGGTIRYMKSNTGAKIETPARTSPGPVWDAFQDRLARIALVGAGMPYSIVWKGNDDNGTSNRVSIEKLHRTVLDRQSLLSVCAVRKVRYALAMAMKTDRLPRNKNWYQWGFTLPPEFVIDDGRIAKSNREDYVMGHQNLTGILGRQGKNLIPHLTERAEEEAQKQLAAINVTKKYAAQGVLVTPDMLGTVRTSGQLGTDKTAEDPADPADPPPKKTATADE